MRRLKEERYEVGWIGLQVVQVYETSWMIWLNIEADSDFDGLCIGAGETRPKAVAGALTNLQAVIDQLQRSEPGE